MRQYRELSDMTKQKISQAMKGKSKSLTHKENISNGLKDYWKKIPNRPTNEKRLSQNKFEMASIVSFQIEVICIFFKKRNLQARF